MHCIITLRSYLLQKYLNLLRSVMTSYFLVPRARKIWTAIEGDKTDLLIGAIKSTKGSFCGEMPCCFAFYVLWPTFVQGFCSFRNNVWRFPVPAD